MTSCAGQNFQIPLLSSSSSSQPLIPTRLFSHLTHLKHVVLVQQVLIALLFFQSALESPPTHSAHLPVGGDRHSRLWLDPGATSAVILVRTSDQVKPLPLWELHRSSGSRCGLLGSRSSSRPSSWGVGRLKWVFPGRLACGYLVPVPVQLGCHRPRL